MDEVKTISGKTEEQVWQQLTVSLLNEKNFFDYHLIIEQQNKKVELVIDIDPGGGFESGFSTTVFKAALPAAGNFRLALHHEGFIDEIGKFFGMEDVIIGYAEFDNKIVVKTNDRSKAKIIFSDKGARELFQSLTNFTFEVKKEDLDAAQSNTSLELTIEEGITEPEALRKIYHAFFNVLVSIDSL